MEAAATINAEDAAALQGLVDDLRRVFGPRLYSVVAYGLQGARAGDPLHALALVERLTFDDLAACAPLARGWTRRGLDVPLLLGRDEFARTLDVFPLEYGDILAHHVVLAGETPFGDASVSVSDTRRAIEFHAKSLLIHLREGFLESGGEPRSVASLIAASVPTLRGVLTNLARLHGETDSDLPATTERLTGAPASTAEDVLSSAVSSSAADPSALFARYIAMAEQIWAFVDGWRTT